MQRSLCISSPACVHAIESSDDGSRRSTTIASNEEPKSRKKAAKLFLFPLKHRRRISQVLTSISWRGNKEEPDKNNGVDVEESDSETTFASANSSEPHSFSTDAGESEPPSFRLISPPPIFPAGSAEGLPPHSPMKIIRKLPFGYVIGRQLDAPQPSATTLARKIKNVMPLALLHLRFRSHMFKKKVDRAFSEACRRGSRHHGGEEADGCCEDDDEDVFWKKDVRGLRCRPVEADNAL
ncbi:hypothetical protein U9M48_011612 [Paspalum notatum var. saurae]|uniref:Uncharacterized protein n=1 Tax=Paspalum notatum var. saurae TaxID=547442 RepID=A0AAQ3WHQ8_PASNO